MEHMIGADWRGLTAPADAAFLLAFPSLFSIINPIGGALIFFSVTRAFARRIGRRSLLWSAFIRC